MQTFRYSRSLLHGHRFLGRRPLMQLTGSSVRAQARDLSGAGVRGQLASPITSHMKPAPATVQASVRRLGWLACASGRMSEVAR